MVNDPIPSPLILMRQDALENARQNTQDLYEASEQKFYNNLGAIEPKPTDAPSN